MAYIANKPIRFDRNYGVGETIPDEVIEPKMEKRLIAWGKIIKIENSDNSTNIPKNETEIETSDNLSSIPENETEAFDNLSSMPENETEIQPTETKDIRKKSSKKR